MDSSGSRDGILAHIASIVIALDERNSWGEAPDDAVLGPLLKRLQSSVIHLEREERAAGETDRARSSGIREALVDLYPSLFGKVCDGCTVARVTYLSCLQTLVKMNPKAFHGDWPRLLGDGAAGSSSWSCPSTSPPNFSPTACSKKSVQLCAYLRDAAPKLRHAVAASMSTLIEGPAQRAYLGMAEYSVPTNNKVKSYISLSEVLGRLVVANVEALRAAVEKEEDEIACAAMIRALTTFLIGSWHRKGTCSTGVGKMPGDVAWGCVGVLVRKVDARGGGGGGGGTDVVAHHAYRTSTEVVIACLGSLASIFGACALRLDVDDNDSGKSGGKRQIDATLDVLLRCLALEENTRVRLEAANALRGTLAYRKHVLRMESPAREDECAGRLAPLMAETKAMLESVKPFLPSARKEKENSNNERLVHQLLLLFGDLGIVDRELLIAAADHPAARIRAAAFSCFPGARIDQKSLDAYLELAEVHAVQETERESTVRSSAVKAYLDVLMRTGTAAATGNEAGDNDGDPATSILARNNPGNRVVQIVAASLNDTILAVRVNGAILAADIAAALWQSCMEHLENTWSGLKQRQYGVKMFSELLLPVIAACRDHEKVAVHGIRALGFLAGGILRLGRLDELESLTDQIVDALEACMTRGKIGKKELQWSCREAISVVRMLQPSEANYENTLFARLSSIVNE